MACIAILRCVSSYSRACIHTVGSGPVWHQINKPDVNCQQYWWTTLLFINNIYPGDLSRDCLGVTWYLSVDMQFVMILAPVIIIVYRRSRPAAWILSLCLTVGSVCVTAYRAHAYDIDITAQTSDYTNTIYISPLCRCAAFMSGVMLAFTKNTLDELDDGFALSVKSSSGIMRSRTFQWFILLLSLSCMTVTVFIPYTNWRYGDVGIWNHWQNVAYVSTSRCAWCLGVCGVLMLIMAGHVQCIKGICSLSIWSSLSRLTYGVYLVHLSVLFVIFGSLRSVIHYDAITITSWTITLILISYLISYVLYVVIQKPLENLEQLVWRLHAHSRSIKL